MIRLGSFDALIPYLARYPYQHQRTRHRPAP